MSKLTLLKNAIISFFLRHIYIEYLCDNNGYYIPRQLTSIMETGEKY